MSGMQVGLGIARLFVIRYIAINKALLKYVLQYCVVILYIT